MVFRCRINRLRRQFEEAEITFGCQDFAGFWAVPRSDNTLQEQAGELLGRLAINHNIQGNNATEGADSITIKSSSEGGSHAITHCYATGIGVLDHHSRRLLCAMQAL